MRLAVRNHHSPALSTFNKPWQWRFESNGKNRGVSSLLPPATANADSGFVEDDVLVLQQLGGDARGGGHRRLGRTRSHRIGAFRIIITIGHIIISGNQQAAMAAVAALAVVAVSEAVAGSSTGTAHAIRLLVKCLPGGARWRSRCHMHFSEIR